jgi:hypothetical protein
MTSVRTAQLTEQEIEKILSDLNLPTAPAGRPKGISKTVVAAASGAIPESSLPQTVNFFVGDGSASMKPYQELFVDAYNDYFVAAMRKAAVINTILVARSFFYDARYECGHHRACVSASDPDYQEPLWLGHAAMPLELVPAMTLADYDLDRFESNTPLLDAIGSQIRSSVAYVETMVAQGHTINAILTMFSDGQENASVRESDVSIAKQLHRILELGGYIPVFIGFGRTRREKETFEQFASMCGYPPGNILALGDNPDDEDARRALRRVFHTLSEQTVSSGTSAANNQFFT